MSDSFELELDGVCWNGETEDLEGGIKDLQNESEIRYIKIVEEIVDSSKQQLFSQHDNKSSIRKKFQNFFIKLLSWQMVAVIALIILSACFKWFDISDKVIIVFITSVFVETLGAIVIMIKFAFDNTQEVQILKILSGAIRNFQKFKKSG